MREPLVVRCEAAGLMVPIETSPFPPEPIVSDTTCCHPRELGLEDELAIAAKARGEGDWKHALHHYLGALTEDAFSEEALAGIRRTHAEHDLLKLLEKETFAGAHLARAYLYADREDFERAIPIVAQVDEAMPQLGTIQLIGDWFDRGSLSADAQISAARRLVGGANVGMGRMKLLPGERAAVLPYADLAAKLAKVATMPAILAAASGVLRRAGRYEEAIAVADQGEARTEPSARVVLALAYRASGKPERAVELFEEVFARSGDPVHLMEKARALGDAGRYAEATEAAERAARLNLAPSDETAIFVDWLASCARGDAGALGRDYDWVRRTSLGHGAILPMNDATTNSLADPRIPRGTHVKVGVSALESPTVRLCLSMHQGSGLDPRAATYTYAALPTPDPRLPRGKVTTLLWRDEDGVMVQAVPAPPEEIRGLVSEVAHLAGDLFTCWDAAGERAPRVAASSADLELFAHAMVHPLDAPTDVMTADWVQRWQVSAACLIARSEPGWRGTRRRQLLIDLVRGPADWTTAAAVLVLGEIAMREPDALPEIRRELRLLARAIPSGGYCSYGSTLAVVAQKVPFFAPDTAKLLETDWLSGGEGGEGEGRESENEPAPGSAAPPADEPAETTAKRPWWRFW